MRIAHRGVSLVEILVAILLLTIGMVPVSYGMAAATRASRRAQARSRVALALTERLAELRRAAAQTSPRCVALTGGGENTGGVLQRWTVSDSAGYRLVVIKGQVVLPSRSLEDSLRARIRCS